MSFVQQQNIDFFPSRELQKFEALLYHALAVLAENSSIYPERMTESMAMIVMMRTSLMSISFVEIDGRQQLF